MILDQVCKIPYQIEFASILRKIVRLSPILLLKKYQTSSTTLKKTWISCIHIFF